MRLMVLVHNLQAVLPGFGCLGHWCLDVGNCGCVSGRESRSRDKTWAYKRLPAMVVISETRATWKYSLHRAVETSEFDGGEFVIAEYVHEVGVVLSIGRRSCARHELNFALDSGKEAANAHEPAVLNVVEVGLCVL